MRDAGAALEDGAAEEPGGFGRGELVTGAPGACRLSEQRHAVWVAAETCDIGANPAKGRLLVEKPESAFPGTAPKGGMSQETQRSQTVVDRHDEGAGVTRQDARVVLAARPEQQRAAMDPHHDGTSLPGRGSRRRVDVERQAVFLAEERTGAAAAHLSIEAEVLQAGGSEFGRGSRRRPGCGGPRRAPA